MSLKENIKNIPFSERLENISVEELKELVKDKSSLELEELEKLYEKLLDLSKEEKEKQQQDRINNPLGDILSQFVKAVLALDKAGKKAVIPLLPQEGQELAKNLDTAGTKIARSFMEGNNTESISEADIKEVKGYLEIRKLQYETSSKVNQILNGCYL